MSVAFTAGANFPGQESRDWAKVIMALVAHSLAGSVPTDCESATPWAPSGRSRAVRTAAKVDFQPGSQA